ncbi:MAG: NAD(P)H-hydrate epimerase [Pirellulaceae bacterium]|nr:NAD(P)H-hydrate epimerase [Pirellulaceae bacterium]
MVGLVLNRQQVRQVDRLACERFGMSSLVLMENAGRGCADVLCRLGIGGPVVICCGRGNNAGDGFVLARHLDNRGHAVRLLLWSAPAELSPDAAANYTIARRAGLTMHELAGCEPCLPAELVADADWIVDGLLGTGARGAPRPPLDEVIRQLNRRPARRLAIDLPSGLDCDLGTPAEPTFRADCTCTFVALKPGLVQPSARAYAGRVEVVDIGVPRVLLEQLAADPPCS